MDFPLNKPTVARVLDVIFTVQRLTFVAGACTADAVHDSVRNGWSPSEVLDALDYLVTENYVLRHHIPNGPDIYFATTRITFSRSD
jgi:hypothetical protein